MLKTLGKNERLVMDLLIGSKGMRRNILERKSGLAKSSLASTIAQLEKRKLITVRRETAVHYVELSEFFSSL